jgi:hypothetical protein
MCGRSAVIGRAAGDAWAVSFALFSQATAAFERGDHEQAEVRSREALDAADVSGEDAAWPAPTCPRQRRCVERRLRATPV